MAFFNFKNLITKYSREIKVVKEGEKALNDVGDWEYAEPTETTLYGAIMGLTESKIQRSDGMLTAKDKVLHTLSEIDNALMGATVIFKNNKYCIETQKGKDNADFTGCYSYTLKWVSAFDEGVDNNV